MYTMFRPLSFLSSNVSFTCTPPFPSFQGFALTQLSTAYLLSRPHTDTVPLTALCQQTLSYNTYCLLPFWVHLLPCRRQQVPLRHWYLTTRSYSITPRRPNVRSVTTQPLCNWRLNKIILIINTTAISAYQYSQYNDVHIFTIHFTFALLSALISMGSLSMTFCNHIVSSSIILHPTDLITLTIPAKKHNKWKVTVCSFVDSCIDLSLGYKNVSNSSTLLCSCYMPRPKYFLTFPFSCYIPQSAHFLTSPPAIPFIRLFMIIMTASYKHFEWADKGPGKAGGNTTEGT